MCKLSIIVPVYNVEQYLRRCLDSILAQKFKDFELIIIDDGSTDNCGLIIDEFAQKDSRIIPIHQHNEGLGAARNVGLQMAEGMFVSFIDSDDYIHHDMYEIIIPLMEKEDADIAICKIKDLEIDQQFKQMDYSGKECIKWDNEEAMRQVFQLPPTINCSCCNKVFRNVKPQEWFRTKIPMLEDLIYVTNRIIDSKVIIYIPYDMYYVVKRPGSMTRSNPRVFIEGLNIREEVCESIKRKMPRVYDIAIHHFADACIQAMNLNSNEKTSAESIKRILRKHLIKVIINRDIPFKEKLMFFLRAI